MLKHISKSIQKYVIKLIKSQDFLKRIELGKDFNVFLFFCFLFLVLILRLFYLQVIKSGYYELQLSKQNVNEYTLKAQRGNIYAYDKAGKPIKLTENITMYNLVVDPKFIGEKGRFIEIITPVVYEHLCVTFGMETVSKLQCVENMESFANKDLLPKKPELLYFGSGKISDSYLTYDQTGYDKQIADVLEGFTSGVAYRLIQETLTKNIFVGIKPTNYIGFFPDNNFVKDLKEFALPYVSLENNYLYIIPSQVKNPAKGYEILSSIMEKYGYADKFPNLEAKFYHQENRYFKILSNVNPYIANMIKDLKVKYYTERTTDKVPILHGLGLEQYTTRYYPYGSFLSNVLGYVDKNGVAYYGVEQFYDELLRGKDGYIKGRSSAWIGQVGANEFQIADAEDGQDIYLTIDIGMQKEIESIVDKFQLSLKSDSVSVLVYEPYSGQLKASVNAPSFNPNNYNDAYIYMPLGIEYKNIIDDETYMDVPVFIKTGGQYAKATSEERLDITLAKYIRKNIYGSQVFVDKNISKYEPGSIFKAFTVAIGFDTDEMRFYDFYDDKGYVEITLGATKYKIKNADDVCLGLNTYLHAFVYSCNVGMAGIVQKIGKENFYNYLEKMGFGKPTGIELAMESEGDIKSVSNVEFSRFINNSFGQGLTATPMQMAVGYGTILNGGYYIQPTLIAGTKRQGYDYTPNTRKSTKQIFKPETVQEMKDALFAVLDQNVELRDAGVPGYKLGGKSGTSQIAYKGKYQNGLGWTNASFVGIITKDDPKYIVVVQVRRPRSSLWGGQTAGKVFGEVSRFLLNYSFIEK